MQHVEELREVADVPQKGVVAMHEEWMTDQQDRLADEAARGLVVVPRGNRNGHAAGEAAGELAAVVTCSAPRVGTG